MKPKKIAIIYNGSDHISVVQAYKLTNVLKKHIENNNGVRKLKGGKIEDEDVINFSDLSVIKLVDFMSDFKRKTIGLKYTHIYICDTLLNMIPKDSEIMYSIEDMLLDDAYSSKFDFSGARLLSFNQALKTLD